MISGILKKITASVCAAALFTVMFSVCPNAAEQNTYVYYDSALKWTDDWVGSTNGNDAGLDMYGFTFGGWVNGTLSGGVATFANLNALSETDVKMRSFALKNSGLEAEGDYSPDYRRLSVKFTIDAFSGYETVLWYGLQMASKETLLSSYHATVGNYNTFEEALSEFEDSDIILYLTNSTRAQAKDSQVLIYPICRLDASEEISIEYVFGNKIYDVSVNGTHYTQSLNGKYFGEGGLSVRTQMKLRSIENASGTNGAEMPGRTTLSFSSYKYEGLKSISPGHVYYDSSLKWTEDWTGSTNGNDVGLDMYGFTFGGWVNGTLSGGVATFANLNALSETDVKMRSFALKNSGLEAEGDYSPDYRRLSAKFTIDAFSGYETVLWYGLQMASKEVLLSSYHAAVGNYNTFEQALSGFESSDIILYLTNSTRLQQKNGQVLIYPICSLDASEEISLEYIFGDKIYAVYVNGRRYTRSLNGTYFGEGLSVRTQMNLRAIENASGTNGAEIPGRTTLSFSSYKYEGISSIYDGKDERREYLRYGTFDEKDAPGAGTVTSIFYQGWEIFRGGSTTIVDGEDSPIGNGKAVKLSQTTETAEAVRYKASKLADIYEGADYTDTRAFEMDFYFDGKYGGGTVTLFKGIMLITANSDNNTATVYMYYGNSSTGGPGPNYVSIKTDLTLRQTHRVKIIYRIVDMSSEEYETGGFARTVAVYFDDIKVQSIHIGRYTDSNVNPNYLYDSHGSSQKLNNGMSTAPAEAVDKGITIGFSSKTSAAEYNQNFYFDNVRYYGLEYNISFIDEKEKIISESIEAETTADYRLDILAQGMDSPLLLAYCYYGDDGRLLKIGSLQHIEIPRSKTENLIIPIELPDTLTEEVKAVQAFLWVEEDYEPLCKKGSAFLTFTDGYAKTLERLRNNYLTALYNRTGSPTEILAKMQEDGSFNDLNYDDPRRSVWDPSTHFGRLRTLCAIYSTPQNPNYGNTELIEKTRLSLEYWFDLNPVCNNWWYNDVQIPEYCYEMLMLDTSFPSELYDKMMARVNKSKLIVTRDKKAGELRNYNRSSSELPRAADITVGLTLAEHISDSEKIEKIADIVEMANEEVLLETWAVGYDKAIVDTESIKADFSYQEHDNMLHPANYGWGDINSLNNFLSKLKGTRFGLSKEAKERLTDVLLDGFQYMGFKNYWDTTVLGRSVAERANVTGNSTQAGIIRYLMQDKENPRYTELAARLARTMYPAQNDNFTGTRYFWQSDFISHNRPTFHFSARTSSVRTKTAEAINSQNFLGRYLSDGVINLVKNGPEYKDMAPVWDWNKLPGTTTAQGKTDEELRPDGRKGTSEFVGGVSDGIYGFGFFDYDRDSVSAKKGYFCFDEEIVMLGAGISSDDENDIYTSVNQRRSDSAALVSQNGTGITVDGSDEIFEGNVNYVLHDGVGYIFENGATVEVKNEDVSGNWKRVYGETTDETVTHKVFLLGINHGVNPENASYKVIILPETDEESITEYSSPVTVLENTANIQALYHSGLKILQAAFYNAGSLTLPNGVTVHTDKPCGIMIKFFDGGDYKLYITNPTNKALSHTVTLSGGINASLNFNIGVGERGNDGGRTYFYDSETQKTVGMK